MTGGARLHGFSWRPLGRREPVIARLDLVIEAGQKVLLAGPSGAGKSTVLHALVGALGTTIAGDRVGTVEVDGRVGMLLQNPGAAIVAEHIGRDVAFGPENLGLPREEIWSRVDEALEAVRLPYGREHLTVALSGGETQRLALAGALAVRPDILLLDEPTAMLDADNARSVREAVVDAVARASSTLVVVEHQIEPWLDVVDRVVVLSETGQIVADCAVADFVTKHRESLGDSGVWMPGLPPPPPLEVPDALVTPAEPAMCLSADALTVDLHARTLRGTTTTRALDSFNAALAPGSLSAFTGPSGAGKSTALAAFGGLQAPRAGAIRGAEPAIHTWKSRRLARHVGWVPQNSEHGFLAATVSEEVAKSAVRLSRDVDVAALLELFGLDGLAGANPYRLSGGEQRRLATVAALAHRPGVMLFDEPTVGQDRNTWAAVAGFIRAAALAGAAVGVSTHDDGLVSHADVHVPMVAGRAV